MADDSTIIEGTVKFRDGKKWKSRWCVMRKLSPVADCVHLQLYRDSRARWGGASKASLSLQRFLGSEAGFTLDKHSNTLALVCQDFVAILAFETRERLIQWQVKVSAHLGEARQYLVLAAPAGRLAPGPARLHLHQRRFALTAGVPPRLLGIWELPHLRRYGVVEGRFCFEGGSHCGKGEGLHLLITDQAQDIARDFDLASQGRLSPKRRPFNSKNTDGSESPKSHKTFRPDTRLSELNTIDRSLPPLERTYDEYQREEAGAISSYWASTERSAEMDLGDTASVHEGGVGGGAGSGGEWAGAALERCRSCMSKLGALSRSSTAALTPGATHFSPAWTMDDLLEAQPSDECHCPDQSSDRPPERPPNRPPDRPPKPTKLELTLTRKPPMPPPVQTCSCSHVVVLEESVPSRVGPYENYDVPKLPSAEAEGEYYDTPKRLKECLNNELFKITKSSAPNAVILKKPCGCLLRVGRRPPLVVEEGHSAPPARPCGRVSHWAHAFILPYCRRATASADNLAPNKENLKPHVSDSSALYATIDLSRKTRRKTPSDDIPGNIVPRFDSTSVQVDDGPLANYENLNFALSLEHYENAKDLLRKAGVTQAELDAIGASLRPVSFGTGNIRKLCTKCDHQRSQDVADETNNPASADDYLMMEPNVDGNKLDLNKPLPAGYTPMSPIGSFASHTMRLPARSPINRLLEEKSASNPTLSGPEESHGNGSSSVPARDLSLRPASERPERIEYRKRSSSADSSRFLDDVKEFEGGASHGSTSSIETLRNMSVECERVTTMCDCATDYKHSDADSSEASKVKRSMATPSNTAGNRDSSSSNDSGVSSCSLRRAGEFELPLTTAAARRHYRSARRATAAAHGSPPRRSKSSDVVALHRVPVPHKSSSAEAEVPVLSVKTLKGVVDSHSTSSGTSDMSDYIETLSICSSHSSTDTPITMRALRQTTSTLRPRSGKEYQRLGPRPAPPHTHHLYYNLP